MVSDGLILFTVQQVRGWLGGTLETEGLNQYVITRSRAKAIVNNPYVKEEDVIASAIYEGGELAAYTAAFPDIIKGKRSWWFTTLWCDPKHQGKGYGLIVIGTICEYHKREPIFDMWGAPETVEIFRYLGLKDTTIPEYVFSYRKINDSSIKGKIAKLKQWLWIATHSDLKGLKRNSKRLRYDIEYCDSIDDEVWTLISEFNSTDALPRSREMLNWILACHFQIPSPLQSRVRTRKAFVDTEKEYVLAGAKIFVNNKFMAFYILRWNGTELSIKYSWGCENCVEALTSIAEHLLIFNARRFVTRDKSIADYIAKWQFYPIARKESISFSYPADFALNGHIHGGDADNFA